MPELIEIRKGIVSREHVGNDIEIVSLCFDPRSGSFLRLSNNAPERRLRIWDTSLNEQETPPQLDQILGCMPRAIAATDGSILIATLDPYTGRENPLYQSRLGRVTDRNGIYMLRSMTSDILEVASAEVPNVIVTHILPIRQIPGGQYVVATIQDGSSRGRFGWHASGCYQTVSSNVQISGVTCAAMGDKEQQAYFSDFNRDGTNVIHKVLDVGLASGARSTELFKVGGVPRFAAMTVLPNRENTLAFVSDDGKVYCFDLAGERVAAPFDTGLGERVSYAFATTPMGGVYLTADRTGIMELKVTEKK